MKKLLQIIILALTIFILSFIGTAFADVTYSGNLVCGGRYMSDSKNVTCPIEPQSLRARVRTELYFERIEEFKQTQELIIMLNEALY